MESYDLEEKDGDWYASSDTQEEIPNPNDDRAALYQDRNMLPTSLLKTHFEEGVIYTMTTAKEKDNPMLVMIIEAKDLEFVYRIFFIQGVKRKTYHDVGKDKCSSYNDI